MVNLVFSQQQNTHLAAGTTANKSSTPTNGRLMPSPVHMRSDNRSVSPLTHNEYLYGAMDRIRSSSNDELREPPCLPPNSPRSNNNNNLELVCDYDRSVTKLYEMLESSRWDSARVRCNTHPEEVRTWIVRRDVNGSTRWKLLPLHAAIIFQAPLSLINNLLVQHPIAAAKRDDQGIIPLHLAFRHKAEEAVIEKLLLQYPSGVIIKDHRERLPLDHGKDMKFSAHLMGLYAETFAKFQHSEENAVTDETEMVSEYEIKMNSLKEAYETRIEAMVHAQEQIAEARKSKAEEEARKNRERHSQEVEKLESMLAQEMLAEKKSSKMDAELQGLSTSLAEATGELIALRKVVEEQKAEKKTLINELRQMLKDQTVLQERCNKQQEQIDQTQKLREQLLRTLLQKEDGKTVQASDEICRLSNNNIARTEKLLNSLSSSTALSSSTYRVGQDLVELPSNDEYRIAEDLLVDPCDPSTTEAFAPSDDHGDDISAITDSSYVQPFGDR